MNNCKACGHKNTAIKNNWCFIMSTQPSRNTCMMWTQKKNSEFDLSKVFGDGFNDFFGTKKK